jgi:2C-methyl-D-erythritol 2,4-cyclodiphosphate synthase
LKEALNKESELISRIKYKMPDVLQDRANTTFPGTSSHFDNNDSKDTLMEPSQNILHDNLLELNPSIQVIVNENKLIPHLPTVKKDLASHQRS